MKKILSILIFCLFGKLIFACTTFCINKNGQIVFGRNYDWVSGAGIVNTNQRGLFKTSMHVSGGAPATWVSKYGSITFNQYGKEFPTGGMNEKGLVVELMWLDGTVYPKPDNRPAVGVLQWIQYQLDNNSTVAELVNTDSQVRIGEQATPIHYLVADAGGSVATIEFLDGKMVVHRNEDLPFPVLTNNTYESSVKAAKPILDKKTKTALDDNSLDRFVKACGMVKMIKEDDVNVHLVDYSFSILDKVSQGDFTKWSIVYDITNKEIHFKTEGNKTIKFVRFASFDFTCAQSPKMFNMNQDGNGDVSNRFILPDKKIKKQIMDQVVKESSSRVDISAKEEEELLHFEEGITCKP